MARTRTAVAQTAGNATDPAAKKPVVRWYKILDKDTRAIALVQAGTKAGARSRLTEPRYEVSVASPDDMLLAAKGATVLYADEPESDGAEA